MEASWPGCSLKLEGEALTIDAAGTPSVTIALTQLQGFTVVERAPVAEGRAHATTPDSELVVGWGDGDALQHARVPVPRDGLQTQLFLARLAQLRPEADLRSLPPHKALEKLGVKRGRTGLWLALGLLVVAAAVGSYCSSATNTSACAAATSAPPAR